MSADPKSTRAKAVLVAVQLPDTTDAQMASSLDELQRLTETLGLEAVGRVVQKRRSLGAAAAFGVGKLAEIAQFTGGTGVIPAGVSRRPDRKKKHLGVADDNDEDEDDDEDEGEDDDALVGLDHDDEDADQDGEAGAAGVAKAGSSRATVVVFDDELSPTQLRNLEGATSAEVLDRSAVILNIFQRHARTREALLQVEIARLNYLAPRLRATGGGDRQRGGIGGKGAGESSLELDRRRVRDRIAELRRELQIIQREADTRRSRRIEQNSVAIVGYTNAGKSSLMRRLTASDVLVEDKLFATLDTTVRTLQPETRPRILVSDTVGFIKKLPHDLVASFRSTLEEVNHAALLVHVLDASDPAFRSHQQVTNEVLGEVGAGDRPTLLILNKIDRVDAEERAMLGAQFPDALLVSALAKDDVTRLHARIVEFFERDMIDAELFVSYAAARHMNTIHESCRVLWERHEEGGTRVAVRGPHEVIERLRAEA